MSPIRSDRVRWKSSWLWAVIWSEMSRSRSLKRAANMIRLSMLSSGTPVVPVQRVVVSPAPELAGMSNSSCRAPTTT